MRSRIDFIADRIEINLAESGTQIALAWNIWPDGAVRDPVTGQFPGTPTPGQAGVPALLHFVSASSTVRQFAEIQTGDCMVDLSPKLDLKGKDGLTFWLPSGADAAAGAWQADHAWQAALPPATPAGHADDTGDDPVWPY